MPGGAQAVREPWRNLYAQLIRAIDRTELAQRFGHVGVYARLAAKPLAIVDKMIASDINAPLASSCGRLFDAVAAALDICPDCQAYEGEAAMRLEAIVDATALRSGSGYRFDVITEAPTVLDPRPMWGPLLSDLANGVPAPIVAARFHRGLAEGIAEVVGKLAERRSFDTVALSGGCFQNTVLFGEVSRLLQAQSLTVLSHASVPANDGGLALGQAAVAAARLIEGGV
jgi:hydrogenase maturation protein HypF